MPAEPRSDKEVAEMIEAMGDWSPYRPPDYPIDDPTHNPYLPVTQTGVTSMDVFISMGRDAEAFLRREGRSG